MPIHHWKPALNCFAIEFAGRFPNDPKNSTKYLTDSSLGKVQIRAIMLDNVAFYLKEEKCMSYEQVGVKGR